jgi:hypothetical protein
MDVAAWTAQVKNEYAAAGFEVSEFSGFPLVKRPETLAATVKLLKFRASLPTESRIYAEGMILMPAGTSRLVEM